MDQEEIGVYTCAMCKGVFRKIVPEKEAVEELHDLFGEDVSVEDCGIVCDDCFNEIIPKLRNTKE